MLKNYLPFYDIGSELNSLLAKAQLFKDSGVLSLDKGEIKRHRGLVEAIQDASKEHGLTHSADMAARAIARPSPETYRDQVHELTHLQDCLKSELVNESIFRIDPLNKRYFECADLFGSEVSAAFPSCVRDIQRAGSCYALEQEDACVHHLMLVLERGLRVLAAKVDPGINYLRTNWQPIIDQIGKQARALPKGPDRDFYLEVNSQFGFLKNAYRNHSEHAHEDPYDMPKALSILDHVRDCMQALQKGGLHE